jgi:hypothetical protein
VTTTAPPQLPAATLSASNLSFTQLAETTSAAQTLTLTNTGTAALAIGSIAVTGANAWNFAQTNTCPTSLAASASCTIAVTFTPSLAQAFTASIAIATNATPATSTVPLTGTGTGTLSINTANPTDWVISNGAITLDWNSQTAHVFSVHLTGHTDELVDTTSTSNYQPNGLYMNNAGTLTTGPTTSGFQQVGNTYIDWWQTVASDAATGNAFTTTEHYIITANDTGFHAYTTASHAATDIAGTLGAFGGYTFRISLTAFTNTYTVNEGLNNLGVQIVPLPAPSVTGTTDPGRNVQNAVVDIHGLPVPFGYNRSFYTKYDYATYNYFNKTHGLFGTQYGAWAVLPSADWIPGGPTKQGLMFTGNILSVDGLTSHLDNNLVYNAAQGQVESRLFGPTYFHFNAFTTANATPAALYQEAQTFVPVFNLLYDQDAALLASGHIASTARGAVTATIANTGSSTPYTAWTTLADNAVNYQYSVYGRDYWQNNDPSGNVSMTGLVPGTYRLSTYVLGQWGELRRDNIAVAANQTAALGNLTFTPENFGTAAPIWTIGTPDRSAHEFLHGHDSSGNDLRDFYGTYNFWAEFAATKGAQPYYATAVGNTPATNDLSQINYVLWGSFDPGLFAGVYNSSDDTTDGYTYAIPAYVKTLTGASGTNGVATPAPPMTIHFTTTAAQTAQGQYAVLSLALACTENDVIATLNGHQLLWHAINPSDAMVRSGLSGYYQWLALQWDTADLSAPGSDNILTIATNHVDGIMFDALRFEITPTSAAPSVRGWNDYEYLYNTTYVPANDTIPNP